MTTQENSLTAPSDRDKSTPWKPDQDAPPLTSDEVTNAMAELNNKTFIEKFPKVERAYADPPLTMQNIALFSFTPAKGATPNDRGVYGFGKVRGVFNTPTEADERAEFLIRHADSYHQIFHTYAGRPFPLTTSSQYSAETTEIDIRKEMTKSVSNNIKTKKADEEKITREIQQREEELLEDVKKEPDDIDPYETYITLNVKKAQLSWTYLEHIKKLEEVQRLIIKARADIKDMDAKDPEYAKQYFDKYMKAREHSGLDSTIKAQTEDNFIQFLVEDKPLPGIDYVYNLAIPTSVEAKDEANLEAKDEAKDEANLEAID